MELFRLLLTLYVACLQRVASSRSRKYALNGHLRGATKNDDETLDYEGTDAGAMIRTLIAVMQCRSSSGMLQLGDGDFVAIKDYQFPANWWKLAQARRVYVSPNDVVKCEPYFRVEAAPEGRLLDPSEVLSFFNDFNGSQGDCLKVVLQSMDATKFDTIVTFYDLRCSYDVETETLVHGNSGATIEDNVVALLKIPNILRVDDGRVTRYETDSRRELERWFMSMGE